MKNHTTHSESDTLGLDAKPQESRLALSGYIILTLIWIAHFTFIVRQKIFVRRRSDTEFDVVDAYAVTDIAVVIFLCLLVFFSGRIFHILSRVFKTSLFWLVIYYLLCALSFIWSSRPNYSLYRAVEFSVFFISLLVAVSYYSSFETAERRLLELSMLSVLFQMGIHLREGFFLSIAAWHTNAYTASAAVILTYCIGEYLALGKTNDLGAQKRKKTLRFYGIMALPLLAIGTSSASNVAVLFGVIVILLLLRKIGIAVFLIYAGVLLFLLGGGLDSIKSIVLPGKTEEAIATGSGRIMLWEYYAAKIVESPWIGYGLGVLPAGRGSAFVALSHNFIFSILIGTGFIGLAVFSIFMLKMLAEMLRCLRKNVTGSVGFIGSFAAGLANSLGMPMIADRWVTASFAFFCLIGLFVLHVYNRSFDANPEPDHPVGFY